MCGIIGILSPQNSNIESSYQFSKIVEYLLTVSQSRGMESSGVAFHAEDSIDILKTNISAKKFIQLKEFQALISDNYQPGKSNVLIGHSRMVTNGVASLHKNNQPVIGDGMVLVHNGIVTNESEILKSISDQVKSSDVDSELILMMIKSNLENGLSYDAAIESVFDRIHGAASIAVLDGKRGCLTLATNTGSLYALSSANGQVIFASEFSFLQEFKQKFPKYVSGDDKISQLTHRKPLFLSTKSGKNLSTQRPLILPPAEKAIRDVTPEKLVGSKNRIVVNKLDHRVFEHNVDAIGRLIRCSNCILPETFPFIDFDAEGVCNYCRNYTPRASTNKLAEFGELLESYRSNNGIGDCIVALSGGRDSTYALHLMKTQFDMNPITFTYDWGMVTDIARQNMSEITGQLGVENILVSANIPQKLKYIKSNVSAWLNKPSLGIIPLFMAGDKYFFKYVNEIKRSTGIELDIWSPNFYENTDFKTGFCGIPPHFDKKGVDHLAINAKLQLPVYYLKEFIKNPGLINSSLLDTLGAYWSYYFEPRKNICCTFDYLPWEESVVESTLIDMYGWTVSEKLGTTWRRGDGTAPFYNYIYYTVAGFSEFDTFRSNQIREGALSRSEALIKIERENQPNEDGIDWYFDRIGLDSSESVKAINRIEKLYNI